MRRGCRDCQPGPPTKTGLTFSLAPTALPSVFLWCRRVDLSDVVARPVPHRRPDLNQLPEEHLDEVNALLAAPPGRAEGILTNEPLISLFPGWRRGLPRLMRLIGIHDSNRRNHPRQPANGDMPDRCISRIPR